MIEQEDYIKVKKNVDVQIKEKKDKWTVAGDNGEDQGVIVVPRGGKISWQAKGSDMVVIFPNNVSNYFRLNGKFFRDGLSQKIKKNKRLTVTVKDKAPMGELMEYNVYIVDAGTVAIGNSPPKMIII